LRGKPQDAIVTDCSLWRGNPRCGRTCAAHLMQSGQVGLPTT
jgi:hypothetical protein